MRRTRKFVGTLTKSNEKFVFTYDEAYFKAKNVIPLGPEFPLTYPSFESEHLFPSLTDRIPSKENPAYIEYCETFGIDPKEDDPIILLSTIGSKGPSSFIFYPLFKRGVQGPQIIALRKALNFTTREFANVFEISQASLNALERNRIAGKEIVKRLEIIINFPAIALYYLMINGGFLSYHKRDQAIKIFKEKA